MKRFGNVDDLTLLLINFFSALGLKSNKTTKQKYGNESFIGNKKI